MMSFTNNGRKLTFLSDDPPLKSKGSGISVLLSNILSALKDKSVTIITSCNSATSATPAEIHFDNLPFKTFVYDEPGFGFFQKKRVGPFKNLVSTFWFLLKLQTIRNQMKQSDWVISVVGVSSRPLWKFVLVSAFRSKVKFGLYFVDDLELINRRQKKVIDLMAIKLLLPICLKKADRVITISEGLRQNFLERYNRDSLILLPTFPKRELLPKRMGAEKTTLLFTGGLSFLYNSTLVDIACVLEKHNNLGNGRFELIIQTYSSYSSFKELGFNEKFVKYSRVESRNDLVDIYKNCDCFVIPYTFYEDDKRIVASSFPQKVAEIIQYGKSLLVVGPSCSSIVSFFKHNKLKYVLDETDLHQLDGLLLGLRSHGPEDTSKQLAAYEYFFSEHAVQTQFQKLFAID